MAWRAPENVLGFPDTSPPLFLLLLPVSLMSPVAGPEKGLFSLQRPFSLLFYGSYNWTGFM